MWSRYWPWLAAACTGILLVLCYPPFDQGWLAWLALLPLICAIWLRPGGTCGADGLGEPQRPLWRELLRAAGLGYVAGIIFFAGTFYWLGTLAKLYRSPFLLSLPVLLGFVLGLYLAAWTSFLRFLPGPKSHDYSFPRSRRNILIAILAASAWVGLEWMRGWFLYGGFGWNGLGVALHREVAMIQVADLTGVWGLSWLIAYVNLMLFMVVRRIVGEFGPIFLKRVRWEFSLSVALVVAVFSYGVRTLLRNDSGPTSPLRVAAIQPNIPQEVKFSPDSENEIFDTLERLTALALLSNPQPQLIVWPEAATGRAMDADEKNLHFVLDQAGRGDFGLLIGTLDFDPVQGEDYNVAALLTERGAKRQLHRKMHLVPFGEFLPARPISAPFLGELVPGDFTPGTTFSILHLPNPPLKLAALVCFEDTLGDPTRRFVAAGAQLLVNITNDGWFAKSPAAEQQLNNALFRTVETRRPLLRCGNTGLTGSIDPFGRCIRPGTPPHAPRPRHVIPFLKPFQQGFVAGEMEIPTSARLTFYTLHGDWLPHGCWALTFLALGAMIIHRRRTATTVERPAAPAA